MSKVTIQEIAKELGLSRNTVSLALKGSDIVSPSTRQKVMEYAVQTGYLKTQERGGEPERPEYRIIVLRRPNEAVFWDVIMKGMMTEAREQNCLIQTAIVLEEDIERKRFPVGFGDGADALVFLNVFPEEYVKMLLQNRKPGIFLDYAVEFSGSTMLGDMIKSEGIRSVQHITRSLISQGLRRIEFFSSFDVEECQTVNDRLIGYQRAMEEAGLPMTTMKDLQILNRRSVYTPEDLAEIVKERQVLPDAFVCSNDVIAERLITVLREKGFRVPEDVAVTGFDNEERRSLAAFITTSDFNAEWLGRRLVFQALWRISHPNAPFEEIVVGSRVLFRRSSEKWI